MSLALQPARHGVPLSERSPAVDFELTEEQRMFRRALRDFVERELKPLAPSTDENAEFPWEATRRGAGLGIFGLEVPESYGGAGMDAVSAAIAVEEIGRGCGSTGLSIAAHNGLGCAPLMLFGTGEQKGRYLPRLTSGEALGALALTEPGAGSDLLGVRTTAVRRGDQWVISGNKAWITNASLAEFIVVLCRTQPEAGSHGFSLILVETDRPGLSVHPKEKKMGVRGSPTHALSFEEVTVPAGNLLGEEGRGLQQALRTLDGGRVGIGALALGLAQAALEEAAGYAQERQSFNLPIAEHQAIQWMLADMGTEIEASRLLVYQAAWRKARKLPFTKQAAMAKLFASETAERVGFKAIQIHGSYGYSPEYPVERIYRDQRLMTIGEGTSEIQRIVIARQLLKEYSI
jgi:alkylation response protein AidB-like acyl-CoA dehydrogenase